MIKIHIQVPNVILFLCKNEKCRDKVKDEFGLKDEDFSDLNGNIEYFYTKKFYKKYKTTICALITLNICDCEYTDKFSITLSTIIHEVTHFIEHIDKEFGIKDEEYKAYLFEYIIEQIFKKFLYKKYEIREIK